MKHLKKLGLLVIAAISLMAFAGTASAANTLTSPAGTNLLAGSTIHLTLESGTSLLLKAGIEDTCTESTMHGTVSAINTTHAEIALTATGTPPTGLSFEKCTQHTRVVTPGKLTINDTGEVFTINSRVEINVTGLGTCYYGAEATPIKIGTLIAGSPAKLTVNTTVLPRLEISNKLICAKEATWTGTYRFTAPTSLFIT